jgi:hypothetical protein
LTSTFPEQDEAPERRRNAAIKLEALAAEEQWLIIAPQYSRTFQASWETRGTGHSIAETDWEKS